MSDSGRKILASSALLLALGALIGWIYGGLERGLLIAALVVLLWQLRNLIAFERALRSGDFRFFRDGDGIWQQLFSRFSYERERGNRYKQQLRRVVKEVRKSINAMPDAAVVINADNEIMSSNRAAKLLLGVKPKKDRGQRVDNIIRSPGLTALLADTDSDRTVDLESPVREDVWLNCRVVPYGADQKLLLIRDVTDRMRLSKIRRDFVANASHELRSPLTVISGYLETFADDEEVPEHLVKPLSQMQSQARRMTTIIKELLDLSRLEGAGQADTEQAIDIAALITATKETFSGAGDVPVIDVSIESSDRLLGAQGEIESVLSNLISNAVRHTPTDGRIEIIWQSGTEGADLTVRDSGEGIVAEHIPRLTERFFRVDRGRARGDGGFGLGLAIVKHVLERHSATLLVSSEPGMGSEFRCHFPAQRVLAT